MAAMVPARMRPDSMVLRVRPAGRVSLVRMGCHDGSVVAVVAADAGAAGMVPMAARRRVDPPMVLLRLNKSS